VPTGKRGGGTQARTLCFSKMRKKRVVCGTAARFLDSRRGRLNGRMSRRRQKRHWPFRMGREGGKERPATCWSGPAREQCRLGIGPREPAGEKRKGEDGRRAGGGACEGRLKKKDRGKRHALERE